MKNSILLLFILTAFLPCSYGQEAPVTNLCFVHDMKSCKELVGENSYCSQHGCEFVVDDDGFSGIQCGDNNVYARVAKVTYIQTLEHSPSGQVFWNIGQGFYCSQKTKCTCIGSWDPFQTALGFCGDSIEIDESFPADPQYDKVLTGPACSDNPPQGGN